MGEGLYAPLPVYYFLWKRLTDAIASAGGTTIKYIEVQGNSNAKALLDASLYPNVISAVRIDIKGANSYISLYRYSGLWYADPVYGSATIDSIIIPKALTL